MSKAGQSVGQGRDVTKGESRSIHPRNAEPGLSGIAWTPRADDKAAVLTSNRGTAFDRPMPGLAPVDGERAAIDAISDPIWRVKDAQGRAQWTPDLVHARLLLTGEVYRRMPGPLRKSYVSILGTIALTPMEPSKRIALTPTEITLADWTLFEIAGRAHRAVLLASAFGYSGDKIAETMKGKGLDISGSTVQGLYLNERRVMAGQWQARHVPVDELSFERWETTFQKRQK